ncbi:MAG: M43 family zinc metalloprotease, partial [Chitinophagales bacterium]
MRKILIAVIFILPVTILAQSNYCGTEMSAEQLNWLRNFQQNYSPSDTRGTDIYYVPLKIHVVGNDDAYGYLSAANIIRNMCDLNMQFEPTGFQFYIYEDVDYINNSEYYTHDWYNGYEMMIYNNDNAAANLYYVNDPAGNCGYFSYAGNAVAIANSCAQPGNSTIAHELGHFFSLPHTFYGWEWGTPSAEDQEKVDGSNCTTAADGFCGTTPDYASYRWNCSSPPFFTDPNGDTFYADGSNFMSYAGDECMIQFSNDQMDAMQANLTGPRNNLLDNEAPQFFDLDTLLLIEPANGIENMYPNYTELVWASVENAVRYEVAVALNSSFSALAFSRIISDTSIVLNNLVQDKKYYWKIRPVGALNYCEDYSESRTFVTGSETLA